MTEFMRSSHALWQGDLMSGKGNVALGSGAYSGPYSFNSRFGDEPATNPEELIAAAHAGCYAMALSAALSSKGKPPQKIASKSQVSIRKEDNGFTISKIHMTVEAVVPGITQDEFTAIADDAAKNCPISKALSAVPMTHTATLKEATTV